MQVVDPNINPQNGEPRQENPELQNRHSRYKAPFVSEVDEHGNEIQAPDLKLALSVAAGGGYSAPSSLPIWKFEFLRTGARCTSFARGNAIRGERRGRKGRRGKWQIGSGVGWMNIIGV